MAEDYTKRTEYTHDAQKLKAAHVLLKEVTFTPSLPVLGYNNRTLHIDLTTLAVTGKISSHRGTASNRGGRSAPIRRRCSVARRSMTSW